MQNGKAHMREEWLLNVLGLCLEGRFEITKPIGIGSYSELYLARNCAPRAGEPAIVVVKALNLLLHGALEPDLERTLIENIALEAHTMKRFDHDHIVRLFGYGGALDHGGRQFYYLVLEYMSGGNLAELCHAQPLSLERASDVTGQLCSALEYVHAQGKGVLHRDVKPTNIMLSADRRSVKLIDFGTARLLDRACGSITKVGTDLYAAPEHYSRSDVTADQLTPSADVYGLAKTLYYMLCGNSPSSFRQLQITFLPPQLGNKPWGKGVLSAFRKATSENPNARYQTAKEFYEDLRNLSELTTHTKRHFDISTKPNKRAASRIIVEIGHEPPHDYWGMLKKMSADCALFAMRMGIVVTGTCKAVWQWTHSGLRSDQTPSVRSARGVGRSGSPSPFKLIVRIAVVLSVSLTLFGIAPQVLKWWRSRHTPDVQQQVRQRLTGIQAIAITDINIRSGPSGKMLKIGLAERGSIVRIVSSSDDQAWAEIEVLQHGRDKEIPTSADRGWVNRRYLTSD